MNQLSIFIILYCNICVAQNADKFSDEFIQAKIFAINSESNNMITYQYNAEFKRILIELVNIRWLEDAILISDYYFPLFEQKLEKFGLPEDLKYLPILESGLNPRAVSEVGATGLWQFMPGTGNMMGLKKNNQINLYYCPVANTDSASRYLKSLYSNYNDWRMVLSSYNYGIGNIAQKIKSANSDNYIDIYPYFPRETRDYIPKFLVIKYLSRYRDIYFDTSKKFKYRFTDLQQIKIEKQTTINELAIKYNVNSSFISFANPQLLSAVVPIGTIIYIP